MSGSKIIDGLKDAVAGNLSRVTIEGQVWERTDHVNRAVTIPLSEMVRVMCPRAGRDCECAAKGQYQDFDSCRLVYRHANALLDHFARKSPGKDEADHLIAARPDWAHVYRGVAHTPNGDNDLITVTRETLRLALHALQKQNEQDYYHNYGAAANELYVLLGATQSSGQRERTSVNEFNQVECK